jgi:hypothetical protein
MASIRIGFFEDFKGADTLLLDVDQEGLKALIAWLQTATSSGRGIAISHHVKEILGHANISQTDTYLNAGRVVLQDSMQRFDVARGKLVANSGARGHRPPRHGNSEETPNDPLH